MIFKKKPYLGWDKYKMLISEIDHLRFVDNTARESMKNLDNHFAV